MLTYALEDQGPFKVTHSVNPCLPVYFPGWQRGTTML